MKYFSNQVLLEGKEVKYLIHKAREHNIMREDYGSNPGKYYSLNEVYSNSDLLPDFFDLIIDLKVLNYVKRNKGKPYEEWEPLETTTSYCSSYYSETPTISKSQTLIGVMYEEMDPPFY